MRRSNRKNNQLREIDFVVDFNPYAEGSCLVKYGNTHVVCTATVEEKVPSWIKGQNKGWITAEYAMLPRSTITRVPRETKKPSGRSQEIQRLIGRSLRAVVDLDKMPEISITIDCDVLQADGGTRVASVSGGFVALYSAINKLLQEGRIKENPIREFVAAVSCDICNGEAVLDVDYEEDSSSQVDMNFVLTESGKIVEIQGTAEGEPFTDEEFNKLMELGKEGIKQIIAKQKGVLKC
ncbi:MAG: ribonuclease PH [Alphaproteobacteria bacterium]|nr:ribonuclease PH [Alphaproteobacteria bacterium]